MGPLQALLRAHARGRGGLPPSPALDCCPPMPPPTRLAQGMGEPLNNYEAVRAAVSMMTDPRYFGL